MLVETVWFLHYYRPEVTLCCWQDSKIQEVTNSANKSPFHSKGTSCVRLMRTFNMLVAYWKSWRWVPMARLITHLVFLILNMTVIIIDDVHRWFCRGSQWKTTDPLTETGQINDCMGNYRYKHRYGGRWHKVYTEMHLKQTLVARAHSIFHDYEVDKQWSSNLHKVIFSPK